MKIINQNSLAETLNNLNRTFLSGKNLGKTERKNIASFIASRQGLPGSYWNMFAPTESDFKGFRFFTGDIFTSRASISHILGEESLRALYLLGVQSGKVNSAVYNAKSGLAQAIKRNHDMGYFSPGFYCCGKCTASYWRNLSAEGTDKNKQLLNAGLIILSKYRDGKGKWKRFPFYYTILALSGIELASARKELEYAGDVLIRIVSKNPGNDATKQIHHIIAFNALDLIS